MKKIDFFLLCIVVVFLLSGCAMNTKKNDVKSVESIKLGATKEDVLKILGRSSEQLIHKGDEIWIYNDRDPDETQLGSIAFDGKSQQVKGILIVAPLDSQESQVEFLTKQKYSNFQFIEMPLRRCQRDYYPTDTFFLNRAGGIIIRYNSHSKIVESYSQVLADEIDQLIDDIKNCKR